MENVLIRIDNFKNSFKIAFGIRKYEKIFNKINESKAIKKILRLSTEKNRAPGSLDFIYSLNQVPFFMLSNGNIVALGSILALENWIKYVNNDLHLANDYELNLILDGILNQCRKTRLTISA